MWSVWANQRSRPRPESGRSRVLQKRQHWRASPAAWERCWLLRGTGRDCLCMPTPPLGSMLLVWQPYRAVEGQVGSDMVLTVHLLGHAPRSCTCLALAHCMPRLSCREEENHRKHMERRIAAAKSSIPAGGRGGGCSGARRAQAAMLLESTCGAWAGAAAPTCACSVCHRRLAQARGW